MKKIYFVNVLAFLFSCQFAHGQVSMSPEKIEALKNEVGAEIRGNKVQIQQMVDMIFSFSELGFQEFEAKPYLTKILKDGGFTITDGISNIPSAWMAKWGSGKPVIALGADIDCIPKASQKPGVAYHDPIVDGAPGHGEGHNAGMSVIVSAALAMKKIMEREKIPGTIMLWPGVAEEQLATKSYFIRDGYFKDVDVCFLAHIGTNLNTSYGDSNGSGLVSVEFYFEGVAAHGAGAPWRGKSALDAVELMNAGWNFKREHLYPSQRSHYVISDGGDQPNVVPSKASVWYYFRERTYPGIKNSFDCALKIAEGAAMMTDTKFTYRILGSAWPMHFNRVLADLLYSNMLKTKLPEWSEADQTLAKAVQKEVGSPTVGLDNAIEPIVEPNPNSLGGGSNDIGDIAWSLPTVMLNFPGNLKGLQGHHWSNAITMATPISHKGAVAGAEACARTMVDLFTNPETVKKAWDYYNNVQTKNIKFVPFISDKDVPAIHLNQEIMAEYKPKLKQYYYNPAKYKTYLEQLGIQYPTLKVVK
jgi:aminobenzoyl-glutamate utilization protein B